MTTQIEDIKEILTLIGKLLEDKDKAAAPPLPTKSKINPTKLNPYLPNRVRLSYRLKELGYPADRSTLSRVGAKVIDAYLLKHGVYPPLEDCPNNPTRNSYVYLPHDTDLIDSTIQKVMSNGY